MTYVLAEELGMTVAKLLTGVDQPLSNDEFVSWIAYRSAKEARKKLAEQNAAVKQNVQTGTMGRAR